MCNIFPKPLSDSTEAGGVSVALHPFDEVQHEVHDNTLLTYTYS